MYHKKNDKDQKHTAIVLFTQVNEYLPLDQALLVFWQYLPFLYLHGFMVSILVGLLEKHA